ncbi:hypothetical protein CA262_06220 [Sphingobium sp. GW456-12-10-14-TSB1]|nr:hypothetical protein CA262_06220 [Sphingobium sp. GW456-12-10-14-TSB1]
MPTIQTAEFLQGGPQSSKCIRLLKYVADTALHDHYSQPDRRLGDLQKHRSSLKQSCILIE